MWLFFSFFFFQFQDSFFILVLVFFVIFLVIDDSYLCWWKWVLNILMFCLLVDIVLSCQPSYNGVLFLSYCFWSVHFCYVWHCQWICWWMFFYCNRSNAVVFFVGLFFRSSKWVFLDPTCMFSILLLLLFSFFFFFPNRFAKLDIIAILPCLKFAHD
jgi:hypothetical protein